MKLTDEQIADLGKTLVERVEWACQSVTQLMDDPAQIYGVSIAVACSMVEGAAVLLRDYEVEPNARQALLHALKDVSDGLIERLRLHAKHGRT